MTKQKLLFILVVIGVSMGLFSCQTFEGGNSQTATSVAVVGYNSNAYNYSILTPYGEFVAPELITATLDEGDCIITQFTIDYDNQPSSEYMVATGIQYEPIGQNPVEVSPDIDPEDPNVFSDYTVPLSYVTVGTSEYFKGKFFVEMRFSIATSQTIDYRLFCNPDTIDEKGIRTLYLQAKLSGTGTSTPKEVSSIHAFDLEEMFHRFSRDTTFNTNTAVTFEYIQVHLKYFTEIDEDNNRSYTKVNMNGEPIKIYRFKNQ